MDFQIKRDSIGIEDPEFFRIYRLDDSTLKFIEKIIDKQHLPQIQANLEYLASRRLDYLKTISAAKSFQYLGMEVNQNWVRKEYEFGIESEDTMIERMVQMADEGKFMPILVKTDTGAVCTLSLVVPFSCFEIDQRNPNKVPLQ